VTGNLETAPVRFFYDRTELLARDMGVGLERGDAAVRPIGDGFAGILRSGEFLHLQIRAAGAIEEWASDIEMRSRNRSAVDRALELQVRIGICAANGAHGRHAVRQIEAWRREGHLEKKTRSLELPVGLQIGSHQREQVIVHADNARDNRITAEVEHGDAVTRTLIRAGGDRGDLSTLEVDVLVSSRPGSRPINNADVFQDHSLLSDAYIVAHRRPEDADPLGGRAAWHRQQQTRRH